MNEGISLFCQLQRPLVLVLLLLLLLPEGDSEAAVSPTLESWSYRDQASWASIEGVRCGEPPQAPINIDTSEAINGCLWSNGSGLCPLEKIPHGRKLAHAEWSYRADSAMVNVSIWPTVLRLMEPYGSRTVTRWHGKEYRLEALFFKSPSENTFDGQHYDMEVQHVHRSAPSAAGKQDGEILITSVMLRVVLEDIAYFKGFWSTPETNSYRGFQRFIVNPYSGLYPKNMSYYAFRGSESIPPCDPAHWIIFAEPSPIGAKQLERFRLNMIASDPRIHEHEPRPPKGDGPPAGVSCAAGCGSYKWDTSLDMNIRDTQPPDDRNSCAACCASDRTSTTCQSCRCVTKVHMQAPDFAEDADEEQESFGLDTSGRFWWFLSLAVVCTAVAVVGISMDHSGFFDYYRDGGDRRHRFYHSREDMEDVHRVSAMQRQAFTHAPEFQPLFQDPTESATGYRPDYPYAHVPRPKGGAY